jgi:hypothetical protein
MVDLKHSDIRIIDEAFESPSKGYVLDFSDRTFAEFFEDEFNIDINAGRYTANGSSKMNRLRTFFRVSDAPTAARVMRRLWEYAESENPGHARFGTEERLFALIARIEGTSRIASTDAIDRFAADETLEELVSAIQRDINADRPAAALDRMHTYCAKKFGHLLDKRGVAWTTDEPLHARVGKYVKALQAEKPLQDMTLQILKNSIGIFDKFNHVRNNQSLAHDNEVLQKDEARFIFDSVSAVLRFVKSVDTARFGS